ncbi:hypothetical protein I4U23_005396 [Adineta vaga]|nr:hypothetical protein I4U23_005396 [Adineta vaga]
MNLTMNISETWFCNRGILVLSEYNQTKTCLCPPSYYGLRRQWQSQRISLTLQFISSCSKTISAVFQVITMLINEHNEIIGNHEEILFCWPMDTLREGQINRTGTWQGVIETYPSNEIGSGWNKTLEIGLYPMTDHKCTTLRSTMTENGVLRGTKNYRLCRGRNADDLYIDEGSSTLAVQWINDMLVSSFKFSGLFTISRLRMRGNILEEEILTTDDTPAIKNKVVSVRARSMHLIKMTRVSNIGQNLLSFRFIYFAILYLIRFVLVLP